MFQCDNSVPDVFCQCDNAGDLTPDFWQGRGKLAAATTLPPRCHLATCHPGPGPPAVATATISFTTSTQPQGI